MKVLIVLAALVAAACAIRIPEHEVKAQFETFKATHGKQYASPAEELARSKIFKDNLIRIAEHNARFENGEETFTVAVNALADMHHHEIVEARNGYRSGHKKPSSMVHTAPALAWRASSNVDWRAKGLVTPVKNQGTCGSCWAFSATGALEGALAKKNGKQVSISEQNLVDCTRTSEYQLEGCNGGLMDPAFQYIKDNKGIDSEESYPYAGKNGKCKYNAKFSVGTDSGYVDVRANSEKDLAHAVETVGPVSVAIDASPWSFNYYSSGVYYDKSCSSVNLDHGVLAVGFTNDSWIVKNSWGPSWGEKGYIRIARNKDNHCGIATEASYPTV